MIEQFGAEREGRDNESDEKGLFWYLRMMSVAFMLHTHPAVAEVPKGTPFSEGIELLKKDAEALDYETLGVAVKYKDANGKVHTEFISSRDGEVDGVFFPTPSNIAMSLSKSGISPGSVSEVIIVHTHPLESIKRVIGFPNGVKGLRSYPPSLLDIFFVARLDPSSPLTFNAVSLAGGEQYRALLKGKGLVHARIKGVVVDPSEVWTYWRLGDFPDEEDREVKIRGMAIVNELELVESQRDSALSHIHESEAGAQEALSRDISAILSGGGDSVADKSKLVVRLFRGVNPVGNIPERIVTEVKVRLIGILSFLHEGVREVPDELSRFIEKLIHITQPDHSSQNYDWAFNKGVFGSNPSALETIQRAVEIFIESQMKAGMTNNEIADGIISILSFDSGSDFSVFPDGDSYQEHQRLVSKYDMLAIRATEMRNNVFRRLRNAYLHFEAPGKGNPIPELQEALASIGVYLAHGSFLAKRSDITR